MGFPTKVQLIKRKTSEQWYINFPSAVAQAMDFNRGETVEWSIVDKANLVLSRSDVPPAALPIKKKKPTLLEQLDKLWQLSSAAFQQQRSWERGRQHLLSYLLCLGRHTLTGLLNTSGQQFVDWSANYRLYRHSRFKEQELFKVIRDEVESFLKVDEPLVVAMDDSILSKSGKHTPGVAYRRDPLGPPFHVNFIRAQRILQLSAALPLKSGSARMIPIDFLHTPTAKKSSKKADKEQCEAYRQQQKQTNINIKGAQRLQKLSEQVKERPILATVDGRFTNGTIIKRLPANITLIGRIRGDAKLYELPDKSKTVGRKKVYGKRIPTPERIRKDSNIAWKEIKAYVCGKIHRFKIKTIGPVRWRTATGKHNLQLVVIAPLSYRLGKGGKTLYRQPAYLICTDPNLSLKKLLQAYLWRWDIEVNFRDEKTILGLGEAQVRNEAAVQKVPALAVASYAMLLLAAAKTFGVDGIPETLPAPK